ncbi:fanconi-associated nuclease 1-like isoform X1 [Harmonia axyridis]|uniref:fanconi-associated nuclease 1-like isoform X1 n=1 Tax=Harmonia axyridis TaxID=115357 RepID=UPI001E278689|nr:fanconi-associated nuclease 1-like isoform X1 [Harmonia axyridis]XP_045471470.1 fanconi-associated nuclease 1-like isoform X1 [Harmonia axyridis]XP_045471475.1 fanconi-associated nuclease 1-like isoform X1 [Harmonia axyridis]
MKDDQGSENNEIKNVTTTLSSKPVSSVSCNCTLNFQNEDNLDKSKIEKTRKPSMSLPFPFSSDDEYETPEKSNKEQYNEFGSIQEKPKSSRVRRQSSTSGIGSPSKKRKDGMKDDQGRENNEIKNVTPTISSIPVSSMTLNFTINFQSEDNLDESKIEKTCKPSKRFFLPLGSKDEYETLEKSNKERYNECGSFQVKSNSSREPSTSGIGSSSKKKKVESEDRQLHQSPSYTEIKIKPKKKFDMSGTEHLKSLYEKLLEDEHKKKLLTHDDIAPIEAFLKKDKIKQYLIMKLYVSYPNWLNIFNLLEGTLLSAKEIMEIYKNLEKDEFFDTDLKNLETKELLDILSVQNLNNILQTLKIGPKMSGRSLKNRIIERLLQHCKTSTLMHINKTPEDMLKNEAIKYSGCCIKLKTSIKTCFDKSYVLQTYSNTLYSKNIQTYLDDKRDKVLYPKYIVVEKLSPFKTKEQFSSYYDAFLKMKELDAKLENVKLNILHIHLLCLEVFKKLKTVSEDERRDENLPLHLQKFSAEYLYLEILTKGIPKLTENPQLVELWLDYLLNHYSWTRHLIGTWYKDLAYIRMSRLKNHSLAAETILKGFEEAKDNIDFNILQLYELSLLSCEVRKYNLPCKYKEDLQYFELNIDTENLDIPNVPINLCLCNRSFSMEESALKHYEEQHYEGIFYGGRFISILFNLLFWDIIYTHVDGAFISDLQNAPLDFYGSNFYANRKDKIEEHLRKIGSEWKFDKLETVLKEKWNNLCQEKSIAKWEGFDIKKIIKMVQYINRRYLSDILDKFITDYEIFRNGFPDLFLWKDNEGEKECKFVTVQCDKKLTPNQILWIDHLHKAGVPVEVCKDSGNCEENHSPKCKKQDKK